MLLASGGSDVFWKSDESIFRSAFFLCSYVVTEDLILKATLIIFLFCWVGARFRESFPVSFILHWF